MHRIILIALATVATVGFIAAIALSYPSGHSGNPDSNYSQPETKQQNQEVGGAMNDSYQKVKITIKEVELYADVAATGEQQSKGLSIKDFLNADQAMLFPFKTESEHAFWMKGMKFSIDMIWLDSNKKVVHIEPSLDPCQPGSTCPIYSPGANSLYVLETISGFAKKNNVTLGTQAEFTLPQS